MWIIESSTKSLARARTTVSSRFLVTHPVLYINAFDMLEMFAVMSHYYKSLSFGCTSNQQIKVFNLLSRLPKSCPFFPKYMNGFMQWNNFHFCDKLSLFSTLRFPLSRSTQMLVSSKYPFITLRRMCYLFLQHEYH